MVLAIILACYLLIVLDITVVITALPQIHDSLHFSRTGLTWVQNAYTLAFGGLLLLGARAGDLLGRRRVFMAGVGLFTLASLLGGLAQSPGWLLAARGAQGVGAAIAAPSSLALLLVTFSEGAERDKAVSYYSAIAGGGGTLGLMLGGILTTSLSWRWGLFVNVPIGLTLLWLAPRYLIETPRRPGRFDLAGAITSTAGMGALVYGFVRAASDGWSDRITLVSFGIAVVLLAIFVRNEMQAEQPITPLRLFASRERSGAYAARVMLVGSVFSMFFFLTQYLQGVLGFTPLQAGAAFIPMTGAMFLMIRGAPRLIPKYGGQALMVGGLALAFVGMAWLSQISESTSYFPGLAIPMGLLGLGAGAAFIPLTSAGIAGVDPADAGAASGLVNVAHQMGGTLGVAVLVTVFAAGVHDAAAHPLAAAGAVAQAHHELVDGVSRALSGAAGLVLLSLAIVVLVIRKPAPKPAPASVSAAQLDEADASELAGESVR